MRLEFLATALVLFTPTILCSSVVAEESAPGAVAGPTVFWPAGVACDESVPTPKSFLGFEIGQRHISHAQLVGYLELLASKSSRVTLERFGATHAGRPQLMLTIANQANREKIGQIRQQHLDLADPSKSDQVDIRDLPAAILMGYGVHGDEASATNCVPVIAHYLASAQGAGIDRILENCVVFIDPSLNPDGFDRFSSWVNNFRGSVASPEGDDAEHNQGWPPGRVNHYWFDLNRDWLPAVHPESQNRLSKYHSWKPNVVLDFHEMGTNSTYFFQPGIPLRTNPYTPNKNVELTRRFGNYHAKALDLRGSLYFTQERFDDFYMGKGSTYPDLHGAVGILFEQASSRGHVQRNQDGLLYFHETIGNQFTTSLSSLEATTDMREELLQFKRDFYKESLELADAHGSQTLVFASPGNRSRLQAMADVLLRHEIRCGWLTSDFIYGDVTHKAGSLVVPVRQPEYRFLKSLLMRQKNFKENIFYDVSTWCLPLALNLQEAAINAEIPDEQVEPAVIGGALERGLQFSDEDVAYLVDWTDDAAPALAWQLLDAGIRVRVALDSLGTIDYDRIFRGGTLQVHLGTQEVELVEIRRILQEGAQAGVKVYPVSTALTPVGFDLGSRDFPVISQPRIATVVGEGISNYEVGELWHLLDKAYSMPVTKIKNSRLGRTDLAKVTRLVMPSGNYDLDDSGWENLETWVQRGGTLILTGRGAAAQLEKLGGTLSVKDQVEDAGDTQEAQVKQKPFNQRSTERALQLISGSIFETKIDLTHPLFFGYTSDRLPVFRNHTNNLPLSSSPYHNPGIYTDEPLLAGYASDENVAKIANSASVLVVPKGSGRIIVINDNPAFRGFWYGTRRVLLNALFFGDLVE